MEAKSIFKKSGAPTARSMAKSMAIHVLVMALLMVIPAQALFRSEQPNKELDIVFYRPPEIAVTVPRPIPRGASAGSPPGTPALAPRGIGRGTPRQVQTWLAKQNSHQARS